MSSPKKTTKRGFAVLDREKGLRSAAGAISILRGLSKFESNPAAWRCGLNYALELVETELNDILLFSGGNRLPDCLFCDLEAESAPSDLGNARKAAKGAVKVLRKILRDARADLSVNQGQADRLDGNAR